MDAEHSQDCPWLFKRSSLGRMLTNVILKQLFKCLQDVLEKIPGFWATFRG